LLEGRTAIGLGKGVSQVFFGKIRSIIDLLNRFGPFSLVLLEPYEILQNLKG
jgi:hypothetical protein